MQLFHKFSNKLSKTLINSEKISDTSSYAASPKWILLADDDQDDIFLFQQAFKEAGNQIELKIANDGFEVIEAMQSSRSPELIFLDINMPRMNGFECMEELSTYYGFVPIIFFSTHKSEDLVKLAKKLGASGYIKKTCVIRRISVDVNTGFDNRLENKSKI